MKRVLALALVAGLFGVFGLGCGDTTSKKTGETKTKVEATKRTGDGVKPGKTDMETTTTKETKTEQTKPDGTKIEEKKTEKTEEKKPTDAPPPVKKDQ